MDTETYSDVQNLSLSCWVFPEVVPLFFAPRSATYLSGFCSAANIKTKILKRNEGSLRQTEGEYLHSGAFSRPANTPPRTIRWYDPMNVQ